MSKEFTRIFLYFLLGAVHKQRDPVTSRIPCYAGISEHACWQGIRDVTWFMDPRNALGEYVARWLWVTLLCPVLPCPLLPSPLLFSPLLSSFLLSSPLHSSPLFSCPSFPPRFLAHQQIRWRGRPTGPQALGRSPQQPPAAPSSPQRPPVRSNCTLVPKSRRWLPDEPRWIIAARNGLLLSPNRHVSMDLQDPAAQQCWPFRIKMCRPSCNLDSIGVAIVARYNRKLSATGKLLIISRSMEYFDRDDQF